MYTRAMFFKDGSVKTITESEFEGVKNALLKEQKWIQVQGAMISADTIARVDSHHDTAMQQKRTEATGEMVMIAEGKGDLVDARRALTQKMAIENAIKSNKQEYARLEGKMTSEEEEKGDAQFYLNEFGEKMYS